MFDGVRDFFEMPQATARWFLSGDRPLPTDMSLLSDEVLRMAWMMTEADALVPDAALPVDPAAAERLRREAEQRALTDAAATAEATAFPALCALYDDLLSIQAEPTEVARIDRLAKAEVDLHALPQLLSTAEKRHAVHLAVEIAELRATTLAGLGLADDALAAWHEALDRGSSADAVLPEGRYRQRLLVKMAGWLAGQDADEALRTLLPLMASEDVPRPADTESLSLQSMLVSFYIRFNDLFEAETRVAALQGALGALGCVDSPSGHYDDVLPIWAQVARQSHGSNTERYRFLKQIFVCWYRIQSFRYQQPSATAEDARRMNAISDLLMRMQRFEQQVAVEDAAFPEQEAPVMQPEPLGQADQEVRRYAEVMEAAAGDDSPEEAQTRLLAFSGDEEMSTEYRGRALIRLGQIALGAGDAAEARRRFLSAGSLAQQCAVDDVILEAFKGVGIADFVSGDFAAASEAAGHGIARVEAMRARVRAPYLSSAFMADKFELYLLGINAARHAGDPATMLTRTELMKARELQRPPGSMEFRVRAETRVVLARLREEMDEPGVAPADRAWMAERRRALWQQMMISESAPPRDFDLSALQAALGADTVALSYFFFSEDVLIVTGISQNEVRTERIGLTENTPLYPAIRAFAGATNQSRGLRKVLGRIAPILLPEGLNGLLERADQIVICPHQVLHGVPFAALPWRGAPLLDRFDMGTVPNLTCLTFDPVPERACGFVGVATEHARLNGTDLPPLSNVEPEARAAAALWEASGAETTIRLGADATCSEMLKPDLAEALARARVVQFGTHGTDVASGEAMRAPMDSSLCMADLALDGMQISTLDLSAELVVLAACHAGKRAASARGLARLPADSVYGLQAAFHCAGARAVIGGLWELDDSAAAVITPALHRHLLAGLPPSRALRRALLAYRDTAGPIFDQPSFWGAYSLVAFGPEAFGLNLRERERS